MAEVKQEQEPLSPRPPHIKEEPESPQMKEEPEEFPLHIITVKTEEVSDEEQDYKEEVKEEESDDDENSSDTEHSSDDAQEQAPKTKRSHSLNQHLKPLKCPDCGKSFRYNSILQKHVASVHRGEKPHTCLFCERSFTEKCNLNRHLKTHTGEKPFPCSVCQKTFIQKSQVLKHQRFMHNVCPVCSGSFPDADSLQEHLKGHVEEGALSPTSILCRPSKTNRCFSCSDCGKVFKRRSLLTKHEVVHREDKPFSCSVCGKGFVKRSNLTRHQGFVHQLCPVCFERFSDIVSLLEHLKGHVEEGTLSPTSVLFGKTKTFKRFSCSECEKIFTCEADVKKHESAVHRGEKPFTCSVCEKAFGRKPHLSRHQREVHLICPVCSEDFKHKNTLEEHLKIHKEERCV